MKLMEYQRCTICIFSVQPKAASTKQVNVPIISNVVSLAGQGMYISLS